LKKKVIMAALVVLALVAAWVAACRALERYFDETEWVFCE
jgi:hypothetical protein